MTQEITNIPSLLCNTVQIKKIGDEEVAVDVNQHKNTSVIHFGNNSVTVGWLPLVNLVAGIYFLINIFFYRDCREN